MESQLCFDFKGCNKDGRDGREGNDTGGSKTLSTGIVDKIAALAKPIGGGGGGGGGTCGILAKEVNVDPKDIYSF